MTTKNELEGKSSRFSKLQCWSCRCWV